MYILSCHYNIYGVVVTFKGPESTTVCRGSNVTVRCNYQCPATSSVYVTWIINGVSFNEARLMSSPLYHLNNPTTPVLYSLTAFSINHTTTFQCKVQSPPNAGFIIQLNGIGTVTVTTGRVLDNKMIMICICIAN